MRTWVALLRGINLGRRQMKNADLRDCFERMGFTGVRTLIASGNVVFEGGDEQGLQGRIEKALQERFGFDIGTVLRDRDYLRSLVKSDPFEGREEDRDTKLHVTFLAEPAAKTLPMPCRVAGDFEVVRVTESEVFILAFRLPSGRFGLGMEQVWKHFGKELLWTSRNWNTVLKAAA